MAPVFHKCNPTEAFGISCRYLTTTVWGISYENSISSSIINNTCFSNSFAGLGASNSFYISIEDNLAQNNDWGVIYLNSNNCSIINNTCLYNNFAGLGADQSSNLTIEDNYAKDNDWSGIVLDYSNTSLIINNDCSGNSYAGLRTTGCSNLTISNNIAFTNYVGMHIFGSNKFEITGNNISFNAWDGMYLTDSFYCEISYNYFGFHCFYGIKLLNEVVLSYNNTIHHNAFIQNRATDPTAHQAWDEGSNNTWYDSFNLEGNFWDDWSGGWYWIDGPSLSFDIYALSVNPLD